MHEPPSYSDYLAQNRQILDTYSDNLAQNRQILDTMDPDEEFLWSVCEYSDTSSTSDNMYRHTNTGDQQNCHFLTNVNDITGETSVKLGVYDYPIDIELTSFVTETVKCRQNNQQSPEHRQVEPFFVNCENIKEPVQFYDHIAQQEHQFTNYKHGDTSPVHTVPDIDDTIHLLGPEEEPMNYTELESYNNRKQQQQPDTEITNDEYHLKFDPKQLSIPTTVSTWNYQTHFDQSSIQCKTGNSATNSADQDSVNTSSPQLCGNHHINKHDIDSDFCSMYSNIDNKLLFKLESVPVPNISDSDFPDSLLSHDTPVKSTTSTAAKDNRGRMLVHTSMRRSQTHKMSKKRGTILSYAHEALLTSSNIWNSNCNSDKHNKRFRNKLTRGCKLWEFIRNLLLNGDTNPSLIKWEDRENGTFKLVQSKTIAYMWGMKKGNEDMTYEKLSRAMRYYYKKQVFQPVIGKRLIYKFGPRATGWKEVL